MSTTYSGLALPHFRIRPPYHIAQRVAQSYWARQIAQYYGFPIDQYDGSGTKGAIISLGGGYKLSDLQAAFSAAGVMLPKITDVSVDGASNQPGSDADVENLLDLTTMGQVVPGAELRIYFAPNSDSGFLHAIQQATADGCDVCSVSWGSQESAWAHASIMAMDSALQSAMQNGMPVTVAAGDNGSSDGGTGDNVDFPASSPYALGCGGTNLLVGANGSLIETVWNDGSQGGATGGGVSIYESRPSYQQGLTFPGVMRGVPDWAGNADPATGYNLFYNGQQIVVGGTSAVAPLLAGLLMLLRQALGQRLSNFQQFLYANAATVCRDIKAGNNGDYQAGNGYDLCTGNGVPIGGAMLSTLLGGTTTPTPTPIPTPTPVPTPTPTPPPTPTQSLRQLIDAELDKAIALLKDHPYVQNWLKDVKRILDAYLGSIGINTQEHTLLQAHGLSFGQLNPTQIKQIVDKAFDAAIFLLPQYADQLRTIKAALDVLLALLPAQPAPTGS